MELALPVRIFMSSSSTSDSNTDSSFCPSRRRHTRLVSDWSSDQAEDGIRDWSELQSLTNLVCRLLLEKERENVGNQGPHQWRMPSSAEQRKTDHHLIRNISQTATENIKDNCKIEQGAVINDA